MLARLSQALRRLTPAALARAVTPAEELARRLKNGELVGDALRTVFPQVAAGAAMQAKARFEGGAVALFIVDLRDALRTGLHELANGLTQQDPGFARVAERITALANSVEGDTFVQHLINTCLSTLNVYTESHAIDASQLSNAPCAKQVGELLSRSLSSVMSRAEQAQPCPGAPNADDSSLEPLNA